MRLFPLFFCFKSTLAVYLLITYANKPDIVVKALFCFPKQVFYIRERETIWVRTGTNICTQTVRKAIEDAVRFPENIKYIVAESAPHAMSYELVDVGVSLPSWGVRFDMNVSLQNTTEEPIVTPKESPKGSMEPSRAVNWHLIYAVTAVALLSLSSVIITVIIVCFLRIRTKKRPKSPKEELIQHGSSVSIDRVPTTSNSESVISERIRKLQAYEGLPTIQAARRASLESISEQVSRRSDEETFELQRQLDTYTKKMREQFPEETEETQKEDDSNDAKEALKIRQKQETSELSPSKSIDSHEWKDWLDSETDLGYTSLK
uniref:Uncharacterized protein n=1 Tax=Ascaris lumbricoides TaxID=6252 RepID=A0A9J2PJ46_ASCLU